MRDATIYEYINKSLGIILMGGLDIIVFHGTQYELPITKGKIHLVEALVSKMLTNISRKWKNGLPSG